MAFCLVKATSGLLRIPAPMLWHFALLNSTAEKCSTLLRQHTSSQDLSYNLPCFAGVHLKSLQKQRERSLSKFGLSGTSVWRPQLRYTVSRIECRIKFPQRIRNVAPNCATPPKSRCGTFLRTPLSHFPRIRSRQCQGGCRGRLVEGIAALLGPENGSRYKGVSQLQSNQSRYSVQLRVWQGG